MKRNIVILIIIIVAVGCIWYLNQQKSPADTSLTQSITSVSFACNADKTIQASFTEGTSIPSNDPSRPPTLNGSVKLMLSDGRSMTLPQTISADGARYANQDESFVFWSKGNGAMVLENNQEKSYIGCIRVADVGAGSPLTQTYVNSGDGFSIRIPEGYSVDEAYTYQANPETVITGVKFTIPAELAEGTNLSTDSYLSVEQIPQTQNCTAESFLDGEHTSVIVADGNESYSVATSSNAGAGNRYDETIYSIQGTNPCIAIRYLIHYGVIQNYPEGTVQEFDKSAIIDQFDAIRRTLVLNQ